jgi:hypothetical protein
VAAAIAAALGVTDYTLDYEEPVFTQHLNT